jgi:hypothetical protein
MEQVIPIMQPERMLQAGLPFESVDAARWCYRKAEEHGFAKAFVRIGRGIFVDPRKVHELARAACRLVNRALDRLI